ncbi:hypothetical protein [Microbacterium sp. RG1]|uniref:hypothetical protein n=1 Tax=Microbacterium sp. RG1 TaxID=2489212 RepID=UPI0010CA4E21|nr:hypothetical protein [Microbacterium sp. RG1]QCQ15459.1 hypothetical protein EHF32_01200 [Microbacterium sp. RG1]
MPHTFMHDLSDVATLTAKLAGRDFNLASLISSDVAADFAQGTGDTIRVRVPAAIPTRTKGIHDTTTALVSDTLTEQFINVQIKDHLYNLAVLSEADLSLELKDYAQNVLAPQARAIAARVEALTAEALAATPVAAAISYDAAAPALAFTAARRRLRSNGVPSSAPLRAAVGADIYADLLDAPTGKGFDADGKVRGFEVIESTRLSSRDGVFFIPTAFSLVARAPMVPHGAAQGASITTPVQDGNERGLAFAVRVINDYDSNVAADRSLVSSFVAVAAMPLPVDNEDGSVTLLEHGGAVRVTSA